MSWSQTLFSVRGIQVKVHLTFALIVALGALQWGATHGMRGAAFGVVFTLALFACVVLHELGHGLVAQRLGLKVREVLLLPIGGIAKLEGKAKSPRQEIAIAAAGPAVNLVIAGVLAAALYHFDVFSRVELAPRQVQPTWETLLVLLAAGNFSLALFNLLPFFPLDGGRILRAALSSRMGELQGTRWAAGIGQGGAIALGTWAVVSGQLFLGLIALLVFFSASRERTEAELRGPLQRLTAAELAEVPAIELDGALRVRDAVPQLLRSQQDAFPVVGDGKLLGVVLRHELVRAAHLPEARQHSIRTLMLACPSLPGHLSAARALEILEQLQAPVGVVTTPDYPVGLISSSQVLLKLAQLPPQLDPQDPNRDSSSAEPRNAA